MKIIVIIKTQDNKIRHIESNYRDSIEDIDEWDDYKYFRRMLKHKIEYKYGKLKMYKQITSPIIHKDKIEKSAVLYEMVRHYVY